MDTDYNHLPAKIFGLSYAQHRVYRVIEFLAYCKAHFMRKSRKAKLLYHVAALEKTFFTPDEGDEISVWFSSGKGITELKAIIREKIEGAYFLTEECSICMLLLPAYQFPQRPLAVTCRHVPAACLACLAQSLEGQIEELPWDHVACPECPSRLTFDVVKRFSSAEAFERYDKKSVLAAFRDMPNFTMCLGPNCDSGQIHGGGNDQPIMTCTTCQFKTCFTHQMPWHTGQTCAEYDTEKSERTRQEAASAEFIAEKTKACPNPKCGLNLDKYTGCDHVICTRCKYEFCWVCFVSYETIRLEGNGAHSAGCKYHSNRLHLL